MAQQTRKPCVTVGRYTPAAARRLAGDSSLPPLVIYGPHGCGKTTNRQMLAAKFECTVIVDDWDGQSWLPNGALALTSLTAAKIHELKTIRVQMIRYSEAIKITQRPSFK